MSIVIEEDSPIYGLVQAAEEAPKRQFKGVWIPAEIWESDQLSWMEKCLWAEIDNLGTEEKPCFASNEYLSEKMDSSPASIANMISKLRKLKFVKDVSFNGRQRKIVALTAGLMQNQPLGEPSIHSLVNIDTSRDSSLENSPEEVVKNCSIPQNLPSEKQASCAPEVRRLKESPSDRGMSFAKWFKTLLPASTRISPSSLINWAKCFDDMVRIDGRSEVEITKICKWARNDEFWKGNFYSPCKLRDKKGEIQYYDVYRIRMVSLGLIKEPKPLVNEKSAKSEKPPIILSEYLLWLDSQGYADRMKPEWRRLETAPQSLIDSYLEFTKAI